MRSSCRPLRLVRNDVISSRRPMASDDGYRTTPAAVSFPPHRFRRSYARSPLAAQQYSTVRRAITSLPFLRPHSTRPTIEDVRSSVPHSIAHHHHHHHRPTDDYDDIFIFHVLLPSRSHPVVRSRFAVPCVVVSLVVIIFLRCTVCFSCATTLHLN